MYRQYPEYHQCLQYMCTDGHLKWLRVKQISQNVANFDEKSDLTKLLFGEEELLFT